MRWIPCGDHDFLLLVYDHVTNELITFLHLHGRGVCSRVPNLNDRRPYEHTVTSKCTFHFRKKTKSAVMTFMTDIPEIKLKSNYSKI